jgi:dihydroorotase
LRVGSVGEATVLDQKAGQFDYTDCIGESLVGDKRLVSNGVVLAGRWWHPI